MEAKKLKLSQLIENKYNPRQITSEKLDKLVDSILTFPEMLEARPIVVDEKYNVLGGNMRLRALNIIANTPIDDQRHGLILLNKTRTNIRFCTIIGQNTKTM